MRYLAFPLIVFAALGPTDLAACELKIEKRADSVVDPAALYFVEPSWGNCVNGQSFQQDALTTFQGFQYATYYDAARRLCIASW